jgi:hypothetical protein
MAAMCCRWPCYSCSAVNYCTAGTEMPCAAVHHVFRLHCREACVTVVGNRWCSYTSSCWYRLHARVLELWAAGLLTVFVELG